MRKILIAGLTFCVVASCSDKGTFRINGTVPDPSFKGSKVYLVALDGPISKNVDSTVLVNGNFVFRKKADSMCVKILRIPSRYPKVIEDLVVVLEPGSVNAMLSYVSRGEGTRLNNILQQWKEKKHEYDSTQASVYFKIKKDISNTQKTDSLKQYSESLSKAYLSDVLWMMKENLHNGIGLLLFKVYYNELGKDVKKNILNSVGTVYASEDAQLKKMISNDQDLLK
ncbi:MAG: DUF4369 domain-containing protein [Bacteroidales bacterium]|jgi:hypothetical protein